MDIEQFNADWLAAWSDKDVPRLLSFYAADTSYVDPQAPMGVTGHDELRAHLEKIFSSTPPMRYDPDEVWPIDGGYCGRWICTIDVPDGSKAYMRGFDLVILDGGKIAHNEVYVHQLPADPRKS